FLAKGIHLEAFGRPVSDYHVLSLPTAEMRGDALVGRVVRVDRFGNVVTNLDRRSCERITNGHAGIDLRVGGKSVHRLVATYADLSPGEIGALFGSTDHLECAAQSASAAEVLGVHTGDPVELRRA